jgi:hypothetical protein
MSDKQKNFLGGTLEICGTSPLTDYLRDGLCNSDKDDIGSHTVCAQVTKDFLEFSKSTGNDLSSPNIDLGFNGLKDGDTWCLYANKWLEAFQQGSAPRIKLKSTNITALEVIDLDTLKEFVIDIS